MSGDSVPDLLGALSRSIDRAREERRRPRIASFPGQCRECMRRRNVYRCAHKGGGSYRRAQRTYWSSICLECAVNLRKYVQEGYTTVRGWDSPQICRIVEQDAPTTEEAP